MADTTTIERVIPATFDKRGDPVWHTRMSPPDNSVAVLNMVPDRIIPVIFVPGVMGSNLKQRGVPPEDAVTWRLDSSSTAGKWAVLTRDARYRKKYLQPRVMEVDDRGAVPEDMRLPAEELRRRGWGEVGAISYGTFLRWLEDALTDFDNAKGGERWHLMQRDLQAMAGEAKLSDDEVGLSYKYRFPVYACGYNWLDDNKVSAERLSNRIEEIRTRYRAERKRCDKVIIVTHSMGGLVARYCSEVLGRSGDIFGVVHGVMPASGAAAVYRRFKSGTEDSTAWYNMAGAATASALGNDAAEMTAVLSSSPGPMQLLPTPQYGDGWLRIKDGATEFKLPKDGDPYKEIYLQRGKWWSMCEDHLMNPLNDEKDPKKRQARVDADWVAFKKIIEEKVQAFHEAIAERYHPSTHAFFGSHDNARAYGNVTWTGNGGSWLRGDRRADVLGARSLDLSETGASRTVATPLQGKGWATGEHQVYRISAPDEPGDGTVPHRSGIALKDRCQSFLRVNVGHEPAFKHEDGADNLRACRFTLRAIVRLAQQVQSTALRYE